MQQDNILKEDIGKLFFRYLLPSISATLVTSIYILADTIMIGQGIGASGMAALNYILPVFTVFFGTGLLLGVGGAVLMSISNGRGDRKMANTYFTSAIIWGAIIGVLYMMTGSIFLEPIGYMLGSEASNINLFTSYGRYLVGFAPVFIFSSLLQAFVRNDHGPKRAMVAVISGGVMNIILDYLFIFIFKMGMAGGAIATVMGSITSVVILLTHFKSKRNTMRLVKIERPFKVLGSILQSGFPSFLIEIASGIVVLVFNLQLLRYVGEAGVVVYSIIANTAIIAMSLFNGVSQGAQPIMATNYGAHQLERVLAVRKLGAVTAVVIGIILFILGFTFPQVAVEMFVKPTPEIIQMATGAIRIYFIAFIMMSLNILYSTYFQSILKPNLSMIICLLRGVIISIALVFILPLFMGVTGIWLVMPITELVTMLVVFALVKRNRI